MKRAIPILVLVAAIGSPNPLPAQVPAPDFDLWVGIATPSVIGFSFEVSGPPDTLFGVFFAVGNVFYDPMPSIALLFVGQTDSLGHSLTQIPLQAPAGVTVPELQTAAVFVPPAPAPPIPTEMIQLSLTVPPAAPPPPIPPCGPAIGVMTYDTETCTITAKVRVCPGDLFEIKKNGVTIASGVGPSTGDVVIGLGGQCLSPGDVLTGVVNGAQAPSLLGPIRG